MEKQIAVAVVIRGAQVLVQKRFRPQRGLVYEFVCGKVDAGEDFERAAVRELAEEVNIQGLSPFETVVVENEAQMQVGYVLFRARPETEPEVVEAARQQTFFWFALEEIPIDDFPSADQAFIRERLGVFIEPAG